MSSFVITHFDWPAVFYAGGVPDTRRGPDAHLPVPNPCVFWHRAAKNGPPTGIHRAPTPPPAAMHAEETSRTKIPVGRSVHERTRRRTVLLGLILFLAFATTTVIVLQVPTLLREANVPLQVSAILTGIYSVVAVFGMAIAGRLVEKFGAVAALAPAFVCGAGLLAALGYFASSPFAAASSWPFSASRFRSALPAA